MSGDTEKTFICFWVIICVIGGGVVIRFRLYSITVFCLYSLLLEFHFCHGSLHIYGQSIL